MAYLFSEEDGCDNSKKDTIDAEPYNPCFRSCIGSQEGTDIREDYEAPPENLNIWNTHKMPECCFIEEIPEAETHDRRDSHCRQSPKEENSKEIEYNCSDKRHSCDDKICTLFQVNLEKICVEDLDLTAEAYGAEEDRYQREAGGVLGKVQPDRDGERKIEDENPCPKKNKDWPEKTIHPFPGFGP